jgi:hypothetical protein
VCAISPAHITLIPIIFGEEYKLWSPSVCSFLLLQLALLLLQNSTRRSAAIQLCVVLRSDDEQINRRCIYFLYLKLNAARWAVFFSNSTIRPLACSGF